MATQPDAPVEYDYAMLNKELDRAKTQVFFGTNAAFLGPLMCSLDFIWDESQPTCWTNGITIGWNPKDFLGCTPAGRISSIMHELGHVYRMHMIRRGNRCPDIWNKAGDIAINRDLIEMGYKLEWLYQGIGPHPEIPFELEEDIYDYLDPKGSSGPPPPPIPGQCCSGMPDNLTPGQQQQVINNVVQAAHAATLAGQPGAIPGNVKEIIKEFLAPKVPWEGEFQYWMTELIREDYSWARPNRRYDDMYLPSKYQDEARLRNLTIYQDVSGSIGQADSVRFNSELKYVWDRFKPAQLTIVQFDTIIQKIDILKEGDPFTEIEIVGRGGTSLVPVRQHMMDTNPSAAVIFSDLEVTPMLRGPTCPVLWVAIDNKSAKVNFGRLIHIRP